MRIMQLDGAFPAQQTAESLLWTFGVMGAIAGLLCIVVGICATDPRQGRMRVAIGIGFVGLSFTAGLMTQLVTGEGADDPVAEPGTQTRPAFERPDLAAGLADVLPWIGLGVAIVAAALVLSVVGRGVWRRHTRARDARALVAERLTAMRATINTIADRIGEIQSDPVASLELYGLFDTKVASSREFWTRWISVTDRVEEAERLHEVPEGLRGDVEQIQRVWKRAHADAERTGLDAVGADRVAGARRAVKAVRLAQSTNSDAEAAMAWRRAADLLAALHLPHLPDTIHATIEAGHRVAITTGGAAR